MIDKDFCLSSYMAFRYIYKDDVDFCENMKHKMIKKIPIEERIKVKTAKDIDDAIKKEFDNLYKKYKKIGILLSGGMDSAILATYLKQGSNAYTFTTNVSDVYNEDIKRAKSYCNLLKLNHYLIDITLDDYKKYTPVLMERKCAPVHSIEPQIYKAALISKEKGDEILIIGESSDIVFGGMDKLLSKDWNYDEFVKRYTFLEPNLVLKNSCDMNELFEKYRLDNNKIDFLSFMDNVYAIESPSSYLNAFECANMKYCDVYAKFIMSEPLNLNRVRNGESKYLIRELYSMKYPKFSIPEKIPMPRPVDKIFKDWEGPKREEFRDDIPIDELTGNQKWQLWCAEKFLDIYFK